MKTNLSVGNRVRYSREFCRNTGQMTGWTPFAKGTIVELKKLGESTLACIQWDKPEVSDKPIGKVLDKNLSVIGTYERD